MTYFAKGNQVFYINHNSKKTELFLTIHPTESKVTVEQQTIQIAEMLDSLPVVQS